MNDKFVRGQVVEVTQAYQGAGHFAPDGCEGLYVILRRMADGPDYYLARYQEGMQTPPESEWELICHESRLRAAIHRP